MYTYMQIEMGEDKAKEMELEKELADEVHIFICSENGEKLELEGLKFYDRSPTIQVQKLTGELGPDVYLTDIHSMERVEWDDKVNEPNKAIKVLYMNGSNTVRTYLVPEKRFFEIVNSIMSQAKERKDGIIKVDMRDDRDKKIRRTSKEEREDR